MQNKSLDIFYSLLFLLIFHRFWRNEMWKELMNSSTSSFPSVSVSQMVTNNGSGRSGDKLRRIIYNIYYLLSHPVLASLSLVFDKTLDTDQLGNWDLYSVTVSFASDWWMFCILFSVRMHPGWTASSRFSFLFTGSTWCHQHNRGHSLPLHWADSHWYIW